MHKVYKSCSLFKCLEIFLIAFSLVSCYQRGKNSTEFKSQIQLSILLKLLAYFCFNCHVHLAQKTPDKAEQLQLSYITLGWTSLLSHPSHFLLQQHASFLSTMLVQGQSPTIPQWLKNRHICDLLTYLHSLIEFFFQTNTGITRFFSFFTKQIPRE